MKGTSCMYSFSSIDCVCPIVSALRAGAEHAQVGIVKGTSSMHFLSSMDCV